MKQSGIIIVKLQGGIGNQLFQWAYYKAAKEYYNIESYIDISFYNNQIGVTPREFQLSQFPYIQYDVFDINKIVELKTNIRRISDDFVYRDILHPRRYSQHDINYLDGYWQIAKYFSCISNIIKENLAPPNTFNKDMILPNSTSLHVRRGDYVNIPQFHPTQSINYYNKAVESIGTYNKLYVFSDDISWCKDNLHYKDIIFIEDKKESECLWLMSQCENNILANSSFSWWGTWLNSNSNKRVIAPKKWFGTGYNNKIKYDDIILSNWEIIDGD
jgi:hypothetical protein